MLLYTQLIILLVHLSLAPAVGDHRLLIILRLLKLVIDFNLGLDLLHLIVNQVALVRQLFLWIQFGSVLLAWRINVNPSKIILKHRLPRPPLIILLSSCNIIQTIGRLALIIDNIYLDSPLLSEVATNSILCQSALFVDR